MQRVTLQLIAHFYELYSANENENHGESYKAPKRIVHYIITM